MAVECDASRAELLEFVETSRHECENKSLYEAWQFCRGINEWYTNQPHLMKLSSIGKNHLSFPQALQFVKGNFQNKMLSRATCKLC